MHGLKKGTSELVGDHISSSASYIRRLVRFREHFEQLAAFCRREQIATIWYVPAANESDWDPNRSILARSRTKSLEQDLQSIHVQGHGHERAGRLGKASDVYRRGLQQQPNFSEFHYRLGHFLLKPDRETDAARHFQQALDTDGHPTHANADYRQIVIDVARRRQIPLIDSPTILRPHTGRGVLDGTLFHDNVHPTLKTFFVLGTAACERVVNDPWLNQRLGTPDTIALPDFARSISDADITTDDMSLACIRIAHGIGWITRWRFENADRVRAAEQLERWSAQLKAGEIQPGEDGSEPLPELLRAEKTDE